MPKVYSLTISPTAAAELIRFSAFAGTPGEAHLDLLEDSCNEGWFHIRLRPGQHHGVPIARTNGVTLYAQLDQCDLLQGLTLNYFSDLSGGGFLISIPEGLEGCSCGAGFRKIKDSSRS